MQNRQWVYRKQPDGIVTHDHYELVTQNLSLDIAKNEVLIEAKFISVDPYMRIQQSRLPNWEEPHPLNCVQRGGVVGIVLKSNSVRFSEGDWVYAYSGWQTHAIMHAAELIKLNPQLAPVTTALGILGMPGRTAWFGLTEAGKPKAGETIIVSGAAGAVGSLVVQFAKLHGTTVIGITGNDEKNSWLTNELNVDYALNYKNFNNSKEFADRLQKIANGIDVYFDNVGGWLTDAVIPQINKYGRIIICGQISQYNGALDDVETGPRFLHHLLYKRATIQGILSRDYLHRHDEFLSIVAPMLNVGRLKYKETYVEGFDQLPKALSMLFTGQNIGKLLVAV